MNHKDSLTKRVANIHAVWPIEEYAISFRNISWLIPPKAPTIAEVAAVIKINQWASSIV